MTLHHDNSVSDCTLGGALNTAISETKQALWKIHYQQDYVVPSGMYCGEPPQDYYSKDWSLLSSMRNDRPPIEPYLHLVGIQGASSTPGTAGAYNLTICWCWKETPCEMSKHLSLAIQGSAGSNKDVTNAQLELAFQAQQGLGECSPTPLYRVNFSTMQHTKAAYHGYNPNSLWKERPSQISKHPSSAILGPLLDCWVKYTDAANVKLEVAYKTQGGKEECSPTVGHMVNFFAMKLTNAKGYHCDVQQVDNT
jgi:hypothetical protein